MVCLADKNFDNPNWQVLGQYDVTGSETLDKNFIYGNYIDEVVIMTDGTDYHYYGHDHLFSPVALIEADGDIVERYEYDAYGKATSVRWDAGKKRTGSTCLRQNVTSPSFSCVCDNR